MAVEGERGYREKLAKRTLEKKSFSTPAPKNKSLIRRGAGALKNRWNPVNIFSAQKKVAEDTLRGGPSSIRGKELVSHKKAAKFYGQGTGGFPGAALGVGANIIAGNFINNPDFDQAAAPLDFAGIGGLGKTAAKLLAVKGVKPAIAGASGLDIGGIFNSEDAEANPLIKAAAQGIKVDPARIQQSAEELTEIGKLIQRSGRAGEIIRLPELKRLGFTGSQDDLLISGAYGTSEPVTAIDPLFKRVLDSRIPDSLTAAWKSPIDRARQTFQTLRDPTRFPFTLSDDAQISKIIEARINIARKTAERTGQVFDENKMRRMARAAIEQVDDESVPFIRQALAGQFGRSAPRQTIPEGREAAYIERYGEFTEAARPGIFLPQSYSTQLISPKTKDVLTVPSGLHGEHTVFPAGGFNYAVGRIFGKGDAPESLIEGLPPLTETVQGDIGLELAKTLNLLFASGPRTVKGKISMDAPAFAKAKEAMPILLSRAEHMGLREIYEKQLQKAMTNAPELVPKVLKEMEDALSLLEARRRIQPGSLFIG